MGAALSALGAVAKRAASKLASKAGGGEEGGGSAASKIGQMAKNRALQGGKRPGGGPSSHDYSVEGMGLSGPVSDASPDFLSSGNDRGRKRSNGKSRG